MMPSGVSSYSGPGEELSAVADGLIVAEALDLARSAGLAGVPIGDHASVEPNHAAVPRTRGEAFFFMPATRNGSPAPVDMLRATPPCIGNKGDVFLVGSRQAAPHPSVRVVSSVREAATATPLAAKATPVTALSRLPVKLTLSGPPIRIS